MTDSVAVAHKDYDVLGGGEIVSHRLAEIFDAPLFVGRRDPEKEPDDPGFDIREIPLSGIEKRMIDRGGLTRTLAYMVRWPAAARDLREYDVVVTSANEPLWFVPEDDQALVAYCHTPPRGMFDRFNDMMGDFSGVGGRLGTLFYQCQRMLWESNIRRPDVWVANSDLVARRIRRYLNIPDDQVRVVYPPVDTHHYDPGAAPTGDHYLHLGRLVGHKRVDELVRAFDDLDQRLVIAGDGDDRERLERMAGENVEFLGFVDEQEKRKLYSRAKALLYSPVNEDFGMVPIEAMAAGTPVLGVDDGFTRYQILEGRNGRLFDRGADHVRRTVQAFEEIGVAWSPDRIATFADRFGVDQFEAGMRAAIADARERARIDPDWETDRDPTPDDGRAAALPDGGDES